jgi:hypothetical protein
MSHEFLTGVRSIIEPTLADLGFRLDGYVDDIDEGGRKVRIAFYRSADCKIQIYESSREGEINAMIAPAVAPDQYGLSNQSRMWHYFNEFTDEPKLPLEELVAKLRAERDNFKTTSSWLEWIKKERIARYYESAHAAILEKYGSQG